MMVFGSIQNRGLRAGDSVTIDYLKNTSLNQLWYAVIPPTRPVALPEKSDTVFKKKLKNNILDNVATKMQGGKYQFMALDK